MRYRPEMLPGMLRAMTVVATALAAVAVLHGVPYSVLGALAVGVLGYAALAAADVGRRRAGDAWASIGLVALGGGALSVLVLLAAAIGPALPSWLPVAGFLAILLAAVLAF